MGGIVKTCEHCGTYSSTVTEWEVVWFDERHGHTYILHRWLCAWHAANTRDAPFVESVEAVRE